MKHFGLCLVFLFAALQVRADGNSRVQAHFGLGQGETISSDGQTRFVENPLAFGFLVDHPLRDAYYIFAEHLRTYGTTGTSMGFTGAGAKYYPWLNPLQGLALYNDVSDKTNISVQGYAPYFGGGIGFSQASIQSDKKNAAVVAVGAYVSAKSGVEYAISKNISFVSEMNVAFTLGGTGTMSYFNLTLGICYSM